jgi:serine/threonine protein kinase
MSDSKATRRIQGGDQKALSVPDGSLQPGQMLQNRYRILGIIGMGGMGAVYQARDMRFEEVTRLCAVKEMINMAKDQQLREQTMRQFQREAEILATLDHPAIPKIYDYFGFGDRAYLVLEYIQGKDLEALMNSTEGLLPYEKVISWAMEVCDVLDYLHNYQPEPIVFRDMKPSNIMIDHLERVRLIDFGIAKTFQMGQPGTMIGTEGYSPPEQYKGVATPAADIYALGASMHQLLTGRDPRMQPPFSFDQAPVRDFNPEISSEVEAVIMRSLAYDPKDRYASAKAFKQSLEAAFKGTTKQVVPSQQQPQQPVQQIQQPQQPVQQAQQPQQMQPQATPQQQKPGTTGIETVRAIWSFKVEDIVRSTPIIKNDVLYVGSYDNNLWALDAHDGELLWRFPTNSGIGGSPAYYNNTVFIGSTDARLYAVDARTGKPKWEFKTDGKIYTTPITAMGMLFFGSDDGYLYAVKPGSASGREVWKYSVMYPIRSSVVVDENTESIAFGTDSGDFLCLDLSGTPKWRFQTRRAILSSPLLQERILYFGSDDWYAYAIDIESGFMVWRFATRGKIVSSPAGAREKVFFGSTDGNFYAVEAMSGREVWKYELGSRMTSSPAIYRDIVYIGALDGSLYAFHVDSGELLWRFKSKGPIISSPTVANDTVYVGSDDKHIYALNA